VSRVKKILCLTSLPTVPVSELTESYLVELLYRQCQLPPNDCMKATNDAGTCERMQLCYSTIFTISCKIWGKRRFASI